MTPKTLQLWLPGVMAILACSPSSPSPQDSGNPQDPVVSVSLTPASANVVSGSSTPFTAVARDAAGKTLTVSFTWSSSNLSVATVDSSGHASALSPGSAVITASSGGVTSLGSTLSVAAGVSSISLTPTSAAINQGGLVSLTAACKDGSGASVESPQLTWTSSAPAVASVNPSGNVLGLGAGTADITASFQGVSSNSVHVSVESGQVTVAVAPSTAVVPHGDTQVFTATVVGSSQPNAVNWSVLEPGGGTVTDGGAFTAGCPINGTVHVVATSTQDSTKSGSAQVTIGGQGAAGTPDICFGGGTGYTVTTIAAAGAANGMTLQADGKLVVAGSASTATDAGINPSQFAAVRYRLDGTLDPTFGVGGIATAADNPSLGDVAQAVAVQADGKIVLAGSSDLKLALVRLSSTGALDPLFGQGGIEAIAPAGSLQSHAIAVAIAPNGGIVAAGQTVTSLVPSVATHLQWLQYSPTGGIGEAQFDPSGSGNDHLNALALETAAGATSALLAGSDGDAGTLIRVSSEGTSDPAFLPGPLGARLVSVAVQADGNILVAGAPAQGTGFWVARLLPSGALDPTFGQAGQTTVGTATLARMALQPNGHILLVGQGTLGQIVVWRLLPSGSLDPTFASLGTTTLFKPYVSSVSGLGLDATGLWIVGSSGPGNFAAIRLWQ